MKQARLLDATDMPAVMKAARRPYQRDYYAMYSSAWDGIVTDPAWMTIPADDHMAHRGDGVFETLKVVAGAVYNLPAHLDRLGRSAACLGLALPEAAGRLVVETVRAGGRRDALVRILLSRGPGSFGISPADCPAPGLYIIAYAAAPSFMDAHPGGARAASSRVSPKPPFFAGIKTVNYLPNVLMKMEALKAGVDFVLSFDEQGFLAEGATENAGLVSPGGLLQLPRSDRILQGTTVRRVIELAQERVRAGELAGVEEIPVSRSAVGAAAELLIFGTTPDVTAVVDFDGRSVGGGRPGPVFRALHRALRADIAGNRARRTPAFDD